MSAYTTMSILGGDQREVNQAEETHITRAAKEKEGQLQKKARGLQQP
jgi:hypothetical protein